MIVSRLQNGHWRVGHHPEAIWVYDAQSSEPRLAIAAARTMYYKRNGPQRRPDSVRPVVESGGYLVPDELVPVGRKIAKVVGARYYVGKACRHHPLNHIRCTRSKDCGVCEILRQKTGSHV